MSDGKREPLNQACFRSEGPGNGLRLELYSWTAAFVRFGAAEAGGATEATEAAKTASEGSSEAHSSALSRVRWILVERGPGR